MKGGVYRMLTSELEFTGVEYGCMVGWETVRY